MRPNRTVTVLLQPREWLRKRSHTEKSLNTRLQFSSSKEATWCQEITASHSLSNCQLVSHLPYSTRTDTRRLSPRPKLSIPSRQRSKLLMTRTSSCTSKFSSLERSHLKLREISKSQTKETSLLGAASSKVLPRST